MSIRLKRMIAFILDWNITLFPFVLVFILLTTFLQSQSSINPAIVFLAFLIIILAFLAFILRDVIFKGRSLGKRIFGLYIYDKYSLQPTTVKQRFLRNIFFFIYPVDGIVLLASGESMGDRVANTVVLSKQAFEQYKCQKEQFYTVNTEPVSKKKPIKTIILIFAIILAVIIGFVGIVQIILNSTKKSEEYKTAYNYFTESNAFKKLNADESKIRFNEYSRYSQLGEDGGKFNETAEIGFFVKRKFFTVICHNEDGVWKVCDECTEFD